MNKGKNRIAAAVELAAIECAYPPTGAELTHRDLLGGLMGIGLTREKVGDILVGEKAAQLVCLRDAAPIIRRLLEEGNADGSISTPCPKEAAESFLILLNLWAGIFSHSREDFMAKFRFLQAMTDGLGIPVFDRTLMDTLDAYYTKLAPKLAALQAPQS